MVGQSYMEHWPLIRSVLCDHIDINAVGYTAHADQRMRERCITKKAVEAVLYHNPPTEMYEPCSYPFGDTPYVNSDPVLTISGTYGDEKIAMGLAIKRVKQGIKFSVVTVMHVTEYSRHN